MSGLASNTHLQHTSLTTLARRLVTMITSGTGTMNIAAVLTQAAHAEVDKETMASSIFSYNNLVHAVSGAVGSVFAISVFYPLDTVRTRLQVDDLQRAKHTHEICADIVKEEGIGGLYRGWWSLAFTLWMSYFIYFYVYNGLQSCLLSFGLTPDPLTDLLLAYLAGVVNVLVTTPLWVANTRLKLQGAKLRTKAYDKGTAERKYEGILDCLQKIIKHEGLFSLWNGTAPSILLAANPAIHFMVYEALKRYFQKAYHSTELSGFLYFIIGAIAKTSATVATYPLQVIQSRLRAGYAKVEKAQSLIQNILHLVKHQGIGALYKGMEAKLLQTVLTAALMFVAYEKIAAFTFRLMGLQAPPPKH